MRRPASSLISLLRTFGHDQGGATAVIVALLAVPMIGLTGLVVDFGHVYAVQRSLQASADAAALAGGYNIPVGTAIATANSYSAQAGDKNAASNVTVTMVSGYPKLNCYSSTGIICVKTAETSSAGANAIQVKEQAVVPTYFTRIAGISSVTVSAIATAGAKGGNGQALNVMIVLDTTASMSSTKDPNCGLGSNASRESCALAGVRALLSGLNPSLDYVGLMVFPGLASANDVTTYDDTCGAGTLPGSDIVAYNASPVYTVTGLSGSNNFKTSNSSTTLNGNSDIVVAVGGDSGCTSGSGVQAIGGRGNLLRRGNSSRRSGGAQQLCAAAYAECNCLSQRRRCQFEQGADGPEWVHHRHDLDRDQCDRRRRSLGDQSNHYRVGCDRGNDDHGVWHRQWRNRHL